MIEKMTKYSFILPSGRQEEFISRLSELGIVDIKRSAVPVDSRSEEMLAGIERLKGEIRDLENGSDERLASLLSEKTELERTLAEVEPWGEHDLGKFASLGLDIHFYIAPSNRFEPSWAEDYALQTVSEKDGRTWFVVVGDASGFPLSAVPAPEAKASDVKSQIESKEAEISEYRSALLKRRDEIPSLRKSVLDLKSSLTCYLTSLEGVEAAEGSLVTFEGFAPSKEDKSLAKALDETEGVFYLSEPAQEEDNPPIKLRNNRFSRLFECLTGMYGMPVYGEWDPTPVLSVFFLLFFAMCMGDAGYGLVLIIYGILQERKIVNIGMFDGLGKLISVLGAATLVVGLFFGTAFGVDLSAASWVPSSLKALMLTGSVSVGGSSYALQMVLALGIGVFHICLAMTIKALLYTRRFGIKSNISTWGWLVLILGGIITAIMAALGVLPQGVIKIIIYVIAAVSVLTIFVFNTPGRNPLINIGAGLWDTYGMATGILGDVLSYIRLYALGLAGGMLGGAFNDLGAMVLGEGPTWQWIPYALILLFGHVLNLLMSCLGAFVHPLRLTFVEYFKNSGYEGKGRKYNPITK